MWQLTTENALDYLRERGDIADLEDARVEWLSGGVSNIVLRVFRPRGVDFVLKQSCPQLRVQAAWFSRLERIYREIDLLRVLHRLLPRGVIPEVLFEDRERFAFGMSAVPADHVVWKQALLRGEFDSTIAARLGTYLGQIHARTFRDPGLKQDWSDLTVFDELRVDPYYRHLAQQRPETAGWIAELVEHSLNARQTLVLADFSPKNILLSGRQITIVDFETGHFGDPAFDLGFFLSHLFLKSIYHAVQSDHFRQMSALPLQFWEHYTRVWTEAKIVGAPSASELWERTRLHLAGCVWARIDGKSTVDYLTRDDQKERARNLSRWLVSETPAEVTQVVEHLRTVT